MIGGTYFLLGDARKASSSICRSVCDEQRHPSARMGRRATISQMRFAEGAKRPRFALIRVSFSHPAHAPHKKIRHRSAPPHCNPLAVGFMDDLYRLRQMLARIWQRAVHIGFVCRALRWCGGFGNGFSGCLPAFFAEVLPGSGGRVFSQRRVYAILLQEDITQKNMFRPTASATLYPAPCTAYAVRMC